MFPSQITVLHFNPPPPLSIKFIMLLFKTCFELQLLKFDEMRTPAGNSQAMRNHLPLHLLIFFFYLIVSTSFFFFLSHPTLLESEY